MSYDGYDDFLVCCQGSIFDDNSAADTQHPDALLGLSIDMGLKLSGIFVVLQEGRLAACPGLKKFIKYMPIFNGRNRR